MNGRAWTKREIIYLKTYYPTRGPTFIASRLDRTKRSVEVKAHDLGLMSGVPNGHVPLVWLAPSGKSHGRKARTAAVNAARNEGVLHESVGRYVRYSVPVEWADEYAERQTIETEQRQKTRAWLLSRDVEQLAGVARGTATRNLKRRYGLGKHLSKARHVRIGQEIRWHPQDARAAVAAWKAEQ